MRAKRHITGRAKVSVGINMLHARYDSVGGYDLQNGDLQPARNVHNTATPIAMTTLKVGLTSDTVVAFAHIGVTDNLDIGVAVPWVRVSLNAEGAFFNASGGDLSAGQHPMIPLTTSTGVGDIAIFGKYHFLRQGDGGFAAPWKRGFRPATRMSFVVLRSRGPSRR